MTWVPIFDDSFARVPVANYPAMYRDGYRVMAGYVAGGTAGKWVTAAEIRSWLAQGPDTGFLPLFEAVGDEPVSAPADGPGHARSARLGARARGVPDTSAISPAMDRNISMAQEAGPVEAYMRGWRGADTVPPLPYVEADAGAALYAAGLTVGTGTPAAYAWSNPPVLYTPANAPAHIVWTQERNGLQLHGGSADIGHVRTSARIWWASNQPTEDDMATPQEIAAEVVKELMAATTQDGTPTPLWRMWNDAWAAANWNAGSPLVVQLKAVQAELDAVRTDVATLNAAIAAMKATQPVTTAAGDLEVTGTLHVTEPTT